MGIDIGYATIKSDLGIDVPIKSNAVRRIDWVRTITDWRLVPSFLAIMRASAYVMDDGTEQVFLLVDRTILYNN